MTLSELRAIIDGIVPAIKQAIDSQIAPLAVEVEALRKKMATVEERGALRYCGVFQRGMTYERGSVVTHDGSAWVKIADSKQGAPGACESWQLLVKKGRDAR